MTDWKSLIGKKVAVTFLFESKIKLVRVTGTSNSHVWLVRDGETEPKSYAQDMVTYHHTELELL